MVHVPFVHHYVRHQPRGHQRPEHAQLLLQQRQALMIADGDIENGRARVSAVRRAILRNHLGGSHRHIRYQRGVGDIAEIDDAGNARLVRRVDQHVEGVQIVVHDLLP